MSAARLDHPHVVFAIAIGRGRSVLTVPQRAEHIREANVAVLESNQNFIISLRQEIETPLIPGHGRRNACPVAFVHVAQPRELHLDPAETVGVLVVGDHADYYASDSPGVHLLLGSAGYQLIEIHEAFLRTANSVL